MLQPHLGKPLTLGVNDIEISALHILLSLFEHCIMIDPGTPLILSGEHRPNAVRVCYTKILTSLDVARRCRAECEPEIAHRLDCGDDARAARFPHRNCRRECSASELLSTMGPLDWNTPNEFQRRISASRDLSLLSKLPKTNFRSDTEKGGRSI